jgi:hypothetical protein
MTNQCYRTNKYFLLSTNLKLIIMKKFYELSFLTIICGMVMLLSECKKDSTSTDKTVLVGTWEGEYSGNDPFTQLETTMRRKLTINTNNYSDTLWGKPSNKATFVAYQAEKGTWKANDSVTSIQYTPSESKRINASGALETWSEGNHADKIILTTDKTQWSGLHDANFNMDYFLKKK